MLFNVGTINWKDTVQNLAIVIVCVSLGAVIGYKAARMTQNDVIERLIPTIEKAIDKESITNTINNAIDLKIDKIKKSDTLSINITQTPDNKQDPTNIINKKSDPVPEKKKKKKKFLGIF